MLNILFKLKEALRFVFNPNGSYLDAQLFDVHWPDFQFFKKFRLEEGPFHYRFSET